jgi:hypothetical protein
MSEWISVKDRLPEAYGRFLVMTRCRFGMHILLAKDWPYPCCEVNIAYGGGGFPWQWYSESKNPVGNVTHWMPLPEEPAEKWVYEERWKKENPNPSEVS